jgi:hypothetical protein
VGKTRKEVGALAQNRIRWTCLVEGNKWSYWEAISQTSSCYGKNRIKQCVTLFSLRSMTWRVSGRNPYEGRVLLDGSVEKGHLVESSCE